MYNKVFVFLFITAKFAFIFRKYIFLDFSSGYLMYVIITAATSFMSLEDKSTYVSLLNEYDAYVVRYLSYLLYIFKL